jgi:YqaJ-like viral recombinase domain
MILDPSPQGSEGWALARAGHCTSSEFAAVLAKGEGKTRRAYMRRVLAERLTGKPIEVYRNAHMDRGNEQEPLARDAYEVQTGHLVELVGFGKHDTIEWCGCSPDGLVDTDGGIEAKCVIPTVQLETIMAGKYPSEHVAQVQGNLWISGRKWWDFVSFCPELPERLRLYIYRVERDEAYIRTLDLEIRRFLAETSMIYRSLMGLPTLGAI